MNTKATYLPGHNAKHKSQLVNTVLDSENPDARKKAEAVLEKRGWTKFIQKARAGREAKAERAKRQAARSKFTHTVVEREDGLFDVKHIESGEIIAKMLPRKDAFAKARDLNGGSTSSEKAPVNGLTAGMRVKVTEKGVDRQGKLVKIAANSATVVFDGEKRKFHYPVKMVTAVSAA